MTDDRRRIDLDKWLRTRVKILNDSGGRGFDTGVRTYNCPLCRDTKGRGWSNVAYWTTGCFNIGCVACERLEGGALELARRLEGIRMRADTFILLKNKFGVARPIEYKPLPRQGDDFVRWPEGMKPLAGPADPWRRTYLKFIEKQWGISEADAETWGLGYCLTGYYANRVIIPIVMDGEPVAFQARAIVDVKPKPKYLTSRHGAQDDPKAECFRSASAILFNYDRVNEGDEVLLVEGVGDVMGWHRGKPDRKPVAVAMLGISLTPEKLSLLAAKSPSRIILAVDAEPAAQKQADEMFSTLLDNDLPVVLATWQGGKDAGSGALPVERAATLRDADLNRLR